ncbi:hypothetical protein BH09ACT10_BH09ACT10_11220 [soil metagenome]
MDRQQALWERLLTFLNDRGVAHEISPGRIGMQLEDANQPVEIVMTPDQWGEMVSVPRGNFTDAAAAAMRAVASAKVPQTYLVYENYELVPSNTPELAPDVELEPLIARRRRNPDEPGGWVSLDKDGNVTSRFSDFPTD